MHCPGFEGRLLAFVDSRLRDRSTTSEDVVQETFLGFLVGLPNYDDATPGPETFLFFDRRALSWTERSCCARGQAARRCRLVEFEIHETGGGDLPGRERGGWLLEFRPAAANAVPRKNRCSRRG